MNSRFDSRYFIVAGAFFIQAIMVGSMFAYGVFFKALEADLQWSRTILSSAFSLSFLVQGVMGIAAGRISDRLGPQLVLGAAGISFGLGYGLMYFMSSPWQMFLLYGLFVGAALSTHDVVTLSTVARWFDKRRGIMTALVKIGTACGQMTIPLIAALLIAYFGWRIALAILGASAAVLLVIAAQGLRRNPPTNAHDSSTPAPMPESGLTLTQALHTRQFWTFSGVQFAFVSSLVTIPVHLAVHGTDLGMNATSAAGLLSVVGVSSVLGRALVGAGVDYLGGRLAMMSCLATLVLAMATLLIVESASGLFLFAAIYGVAHGGLFTVVAPILAEYFGTAAHGAIFGMVLFFGTLGGSLGPVLAGMAFDQTGSYQLVFSALTTLTLIGLLLLTTLTPIKR